MPYAQATMVSFTADELEAHLNVFTEHPSGGCGCQCQSQGQCQCQCQSQQL